MPPARGTGARPQNYGSVFPDFNSFSACYDAICAEPHTAMVILLNSGNADVHESVFYYKPRCIPEDEDIKLCHPAVWEHAGRRTDVCRQNELDLITIATNDDQ